MRPKKRETISTLQKLIKYILEDTIRQNGLLPVVLHALSDEKPFTIGTENTLQLVELADVFSQALTETKAYLYAATLPITIEDQPFALVWIESPRSARGCLFQLLFDDDSAFLDLGDPLLLDEVPKGNPFVGLLRERP
jgi:lipopolysaccharide biosynthesis glycosyltransferase